MIKNNDHKMICKFPNSIGVDNILYFNNVTNFAQTFCISRFFLYNTSITRINQLGQKLNYKISDEQFIFCTILINNKIKKNKILCIKKYNNDKDVLYESTDQIDISQPIKEVAISFMDNMNNILPLFPQLDIKYIIKGSALQIKTPEQKDFFDNKYSYIFFKDTLLLPGEKILINDQLINIIGTCKIEAADNYYNLIDIDNKDNHNCSIIEWSTTYIGSLPKIFRAPSFHFVISS